MLNFSPKIGLGMLIKKHVLNKTEHTDKGSTVVNSDRGSLLESKNNLEKNFQVTFLV